MNFRGNSYSWRFFTNFSPYKSQLQTFISRRVNIVRVNILMQKSALDTNCQYSNEFIRALTLIYEVWQNAQLTCIYIHSMLNQCDDNNVKYTQVAYFSFLWLAFVSRGEHCRRNPLKPWSYTKYKNTIPMASNRAHHFLNLWYVRRNGHQNQSYPSPNSRDKNRSTPPDPCDKNRSTPLNLKPPYILLLNTP